jgi:hypothetical protein
MKDMQSFNEFIGEKEDLLSFESILNESVDQNAIDEAVEAFIKKAKDFPRLF